MQTCSIQRWDAVQAMIMITVKIMWTNNHRQRLFDNCFDLLGSVFLRNQSECPFTATLRLNFGTLVWMLIGGFNKMNKQSRQIFSFETETTSCGSEFFLSNSYNAWSTIGFLPFFFTRTFAPTEILNGPHAWKEQCREKSEKRVITAVINSKTSGTVLHAERHRNWSVSLMERQKADTNARSHVRQRQEKMFITKIRPATSKECDMSSTTRSLSTNWMLQQSNKLFVSSKKSLIADSNHGPLHY